MLVALTACGAPTPSAVDEGGSTNSTLTVTRAWSRSAPVGAEDVAVYFDVVSSITEEIVGVAVNSEIADEAELHETESMRGHSSGGAEAVGDSAADQSAMAHSPADNSNGDHDMMSMSMVGTVALPANEVVRFAPGGNHVMLRRVRKALAVGDEFELTLELRGGEPTSVVVTVSEEAPQPQ